MERDAKRYLINDVCFGQIVDSDGHIIQKNATIYRVIKNGMICYKPVSKEVSYVHYSAENVKVVSTLKEFLNQVGETLQEESFKDILCLYRSNQLTYDEIMQIKSIACKRKKMKPEEMSKMKFHVEQSIKYICDILGLNTFAGMRTSYVDAMKIIPVVVKAESVAKFKLQLQTILPLPLINDNELVFYNDGQNLDPLLKDLLKNNGIALSESLMSNTFSITIGPNSIEFDKSKLPETGNMKRYVKSE